MKILEAIYERRAVRSFVDKKVERETVLELLNAAVQAPSAHNSQPWAFAIVQDRALLRSHSERAKARLLQAGTSDEQTRELLATPEFDLFYRAGPLVIVCARTDKPGAAEDCALAAENLMLAACELGLGTCPIGLARPFFSSREVKAELGIPESFAPVLPIIVGFPKVDTAPMPRDDPRIFCWKV